MTAIAFDLPPTIPAAGSSIRATPLGPPILRRAWLDADRWTQLFEIRLKPYSGASHFLLNQQETTEKVPQSYLPAIIAGIKQAAAEGFAIFRPIVNVEIDIFGGPYWNQVDAELSEYAVYETFLTALEVMHFSPIDWQPDTGPPVAKPPALLELEERSGLTFAAIPAGSYLVGAGQVAPYSILSKWAKGVTGVSARPQGLAPVDPFFISTELIRRRCLDRLLPTRPALQELIAPLEETADILSLSYPDAAAIATALDLALPRWDEWEIAGRGPQSYLYPWGNTVDRATLTTSSKSEYYEWEDPVSDMGSRTREFGFHETPYIYSFGPYADAVSPFGLTDLILPTYWSKCWMEWNVPEQPEDIFSKPLLRSPCTLGSPKYGCQGTTLPMMKKGSSLDKAAFRLVYRV